MGRKARSMMKLPFSLVFFLCKINPGSTDNCAKSGTRVLKLHCVPTDMILHKSRTTVSSVGKGNVSLSF